VIACLPDRSNESSLGRSHRVALALFNTWGFPNGYAGRTRLVSAKVVFQELARFTVADSHAVIIIRFSNEAAMVDPTAVQISGLGQVLIAVIGETLGLAPGAATRGTPTTGFFGTVCPPAAIVHLEVVLYIDRPAIAKYNVGTSSKG
jgi:hypothetical protein